MNRHGGTTNAPLTILKSAGNLLSSRGTSTTSGQKPLIFVTLNSKRKALGFAAISSQRIFAGFSNGCKKATYRGNTGSRARRSLMNRKEVENAVVLLRVGIDTGSGGMHGPLFSDGS